MEITPLSPTWIPQAAALDRECFSLPWSENALRSELSNENALWLAAAEGESLLGYVGAQISFEDADMMNLAVTPARRRQGVAAALVLALEEALAARGVTTLTLEVRASNAPAQALYQKLGYSQIARRPGYYLRPREDALLYRKELVP